MDEDYATGDHETATANYAAVKDFFRQYPEFAKHEFFISGEGKGASFMTRKEQDGKTFFFTAGNGSR